jgi:hypothetical protein
MYRTYDIQTAPFHLYEKQRYGNKFWISRPNEVILDEYTECKKSKCTDFPVDELEM